jgi:hypothetical protein
MLLSSVSNPTIAARCARRTVSGVLAIRTYLRGEDAGRKRSRQLQRGFEAAAGTLSGSPGVRMRGLETRTVDCFREDTRGLWFRHPGGCGSQRCGRTGLSQALPLAVFPHPGRSLCWITIRHKFSGGVYRVPSADLGCKNSFVTATPPSLQDAILLKS